MIVGAGTFIGTHIFSIGRDLVFSASNVASIFAWLSALGLNDLRGRKIRVNALYGENRSMTIKTLVTAVSVFLWLPATGVQADDRHLYEFTVYNSPAIDTVSEAYVGDRLLKHGHGEWKDCITPRRKLTRKQGLWTGEYRAGSPLCKEKLKDKLYQPLYVNATYANNGRKNGVSLKEKGGKYRICQREMGLRGYCVKDVSANDLKIGQTFIFSENSVQQAIEYAGRNGDTLSFIYAEYTNNFSRETSNRAFTIDLTGGNVIAFKGAVIEVLEATNSQVKYRIVRSFPSVDES